MNEHIEVLNRYVVETLPNYGSNAHTILEIAMRLKSR